MILLILNLVFYTKIKNILLIPIINGIYKLLSKSFFINLNILKKYIEYS